MTWRQFDSFSVDVPPETIRPILNVLPDGFQISVTVLQPRSYNKCIKPEANIYTELKQEIQKEKKV